MKLSLEGKKVLLGVTGGIAAYKIPELVRLLQKRGASVSVVLTENGKRFVSEYTLKILTSGRCFSDAFGDGIPHIDLARWADIIAIVPASYNTIGKIASGIADNLLTTIVAASKVPIMLFPAMNTAMYENPVNQKNLEYLKSIGYRIVAPGEGILACGEEGPGRMPDPEEILMFIQQGLGDNAFSGIKIIITTGGTEEPMDPVRVITNRSSGRMGVEIAKAFFYRGGDVLLLHGRMNVPVPSVIQSISTPDTETMEKALQKNIKDAHVLVMAAAVSDFVPTYSDKKIKRKNSGINIHLKPNRDLLATIAKKWKKGVVVGFTLDDDSVLLESAYEKMKTKHCDIMIANSIEAIGGEKTRGYIVTKEGEEWFETTKEELAWMITEKVRQLKS